MINYAKSIGVNPEMLESAWNKNNSIRDNKDWLAKKGRAVSED